MGLFVALTLAACGNTATTPTAPGNTTTEATAPATNNSSLAVGIVLPTKDEPRWIQDESRFKEAFTKAGYQAEILFSQGDSAKAVSYTHLTLPTNREV